MYPATNKVRSAGNEIQMSVVKSAYHSLIPVSGLEVETAVIVALVCGTIRSIFIPMSTELKPKANLLRSAGIGATVAALLGPVVGTFAMILASVARELSSASDFVPMIAWGMIVSAYGIVMMGLPALVLGALGGLYIHWRLPRASKFCLNIEVCVLGAALGAAIPMVVIGRGHNDLLRTFVPAGAVAGVASALLIVHLLRRNPPRTAPTPPLPIVSCQ
jgi:hypothetical protein